MSSQDNSEQFESLKKTSASFPDAPGVYIFKNRFDTVLYVGKAVSLKKRTASYFNQKGLESPKIRSLITQADHLEYVLTEDENQAFLLESNLIKRHRPRYNVVLRDDKSYPYLKLTMNESFPRVLVSRKPHEDGSKYYGPYPNLKLREIIKLIYRYFNLRDCNIDINGKAERACLSYQIKQCPGPCIGVVQKNEYGRLVKRVQWFLEGRHDELLQHVRNEMTKASNAQEYEEAAKYRDLAAAIEQIQGNYAVILPEKRDLDVIAMAEGLGKVLVSILQVRQGKVIDHVKFSLENELEHLLPEVLPLFLRQYYLPGVFMPDEILVPSNLWQGSEARAWLKNSRNEPIPFTTAKDGWRFDLLEMAEKNVLSSLKEDLKRTDLLKDLQKLLNLKEIPRDIACFDISTLQGSFTVGSSVFFRDGVPEKSRYRKFKIKELQGQDDFRSHQEMMKRYVHLLEREGNIPPQLFLIDGGKGQLHAVEQVLSRELPGGFGLASLAKREEEVFVPGQSHPIDFKGHLQVRHLLQRLRDESHRFAVGYHRVLRDKQLVTSVLEKVKGIGPRRLGALLNRFESIQGMKDASVEEFETIPGFTRELAHHLFEAIHE